MGIYVAKSYLPIQNFENTRSKICSLSVFPVISPSAFRASRTSEATSSDGMSFIVFSAADIKQLLAFERAWAWRELTSMSSAAGSMELDFIN